MRDKEDQEDKEDKEDKERQSLCDQWCVPLPTYMKTSLLNGAAVLSLSPSVAVQSCCMSIVFCHVHKRQVMSAFQHDVLFYLSLCL